MNDLTEYRPEVRPVPLRMRSLPIRRGYPVPWFVAMVDGDYHFPTADGKKLIQAVKRSLCWVCGQPLGRYVSFVIGPMCAVNHTTSEPPNHLECALFSARACPFLSRPHMKRQKDVPEGAEPPAGNHIERNPGATLVWTTRSYHIRSMPRGTKGVLFRIGEPTDVQWFAHGRKATREEVMESINTGLPFLREVAALEGERGLHDLDVAVEKALKLVPA